MDRLRTVIRISRSASAILATRASAVVGIIIIPLFDILFSLLLGSSLNADNLVRIGYASALLGIAVTTMSFMDQSIVYARAAGVLQEVIQRRRFDTAYWADISATACAAGLAMGIIPFIGVFAFDTHHNTAALMLSLAAVPAALAVGAALGLFTSGIGLLLPDPYAVSNAVSMLLPVTAGTVVPLHYYPWGSGTVLRFFPVSSIIQAVAGSGAFVQAVLIELIHTAVWAILGAVCMDIARRRLRSGKIPEIL